MRAACIQITAGREPAENIATADRLIRDAAAAGAAFISTPECTHVLETDKTRLAGVTHPEADEPAIPHFAALARELGITLHIGSLVLKLPDGKFANRGFLFGPDGAQLAAYDKAHMFDVDLPGGESYRESDSYAAGERLVHTAFPPFERLGLTICYDLRFPDQYRRLAQAGCGLITVPAAFTRVTGEAHWHVLLRARAIETGAFVIAAAQTGDHPCGRKTYGYSLIVAPWGEVLADGGTGIGIVTADLDPQAVADARRRIPAWRQDRILKDASGVHVG